MIALFFHQELYDGFAVDEAVKVYAAFASMELSREEQGYRVSVVALPEAAAAGVDERDLAAELANFALGKTIEKSHGRSAP